MTAVGAIGFVAILIAFGFNAVGRLPTGGYVYSGLNLVGASILAWYATDKDVPIFVALEGAWAAIALFGLGRKLYADRHRWCRASG